MLLQNIYEISILCNKIRLIVNELGNNVIGATTVTDRNIGDKVYVSRTTIVTDRNIGDKVYVSRMNLIPPDLGLSLKFQQKQFLLTVFKSRSGLMVLILDKDGNPKSSTTNIT
ncbi:uncharacterized protein LOC107460462 [Arachis duranensis]|uniref:Uncharacterized protein LOC107460462 n=1 Tax=Arachis duranensis TaxID=130453 RepID=A0A6P4BZW7_ARADU|nr:uncharacterized protein LOC107460462 [Arachis duranensis]